LIANGARHQSIISDGDLILARKSLVSSKVYRKGSSANFDFTTPKSKKWSDMTDTFSNSISPSALMKNSIAALVFDLGISSSLKM
jgi:hypothetical protein